MPTDLANQYYRNETEQRRHPRPWLYWILVVVAAMAGMIAMILA
ncbi:MAG: hypothetical protein AAB817_01000 [Patescibacteria group bacterium]